MLLIPTRGCRNFVGGFFADEQRPSQCSSSLSALSLEHTKLDVTDVPGVAFGDEVVLIGAQGSQAITLGETAKTANRQVRELLSGLVCKLPYVYFRDGKAVWLSWHLGEVNLAES